MLKVNASRRLAALAFAGLIAHGGMAHAEGPAPDDPRARAVSLTKEASNAYAAGLYRQALEIFDRAYGIYPAPAILLNLSRTELKLGACDEALRYARMFAQGGKAGASGAQDPVQWLAELVADCPAVEVSSTPPGASIQLVGVPQAEGSVTPWHGRLVAGDYAVVLHKPGFQDLRAVLKVVRDAPASQAFTLTPVQPPLAASPPPPVDLKAPVDLTAPPPADDKLAAAAVHPPAKPLKVVGWVGTAVGGAALVTGIALGASVASDKTALTKASSSRTTAEANAQVQSINSRALGANVLFGVGGAIAVVGVVLTFAF